MTTEAWQLPDGRIVNATLISDEAVESREFMEQIAEALVKNQSPDNLKELEKQQRDRAKREYVFPENKNAPATRRKGVLAKT